MSDDPSERLHLDDEALAFAARVFQLARDGDPMELRDLLAQGLPPDLRNDKGDSLLMLAAYNGNEGAVRALLEHKADPDLGNDKGQVPLAGVAFKGELGIAELLLDAGAAVDGPPGTDRTPLMTAAMFDKVEIVEALLEKGADPNRKDGGGVSALDLARSMGAERTAALLTSRSLGGEPSEVGRSQEANRMDMYGFWRSQATFRIRVALNLKGIGYKEIPINLDEGEQNAEAFRQINPLGSVPALMVDGRPLTQSAAILEYIEETHPEPPLLPKDPIGRARVRSLAAVAISDAHPLIVPRIKRYLSETAGFDAERWKVWQTHWLSAGLCGLESRLADDEATDAFCHGNAPTIADICLVGLYAGAKTFKIDVENIPTVERIVAHCKAQPAFEAAEAVRQADYPADVRLTEVS